VIEFWQGPPTPAHAIEGRPAALPGGGGGRTGATRFAQFCPPAVAVDFGSAALLWFCSKATDAIKYPNPNPNPNAHGERALLASDLLSRAAELVGGSGYLWELAAAASALGLLDERTLTLALTLALALALALALTLTLP
jgi:hypothetical protein